MTEIKIPSGARRIILALESLGFKAYVVGGCVRDSLLGLEPHDWDICTNAFPKWVKRSMVNHPVINTGLKHGTVTVVMEDGSYEVTTFRVDGHYSDHRHADSVVFTDCVEADLSRRDFTINAMAYNEAEGLIDPFGGREDLAAGIIRCVGDPMQRFNEDALRIMRALRFKATFGFDIDAKTAAAVHALKKTINNVSAERIRSELCKLLLGEHVLPVLVDFSDVMATIIPELAPCIGFNQNNRFHCYTVYGHIAHAVDNYKGDDVVAKLALLLHDIGKPSCYTEDEKGGHFHGHGLPGATMANDILRRLRFDNKTREAVTELVLHHDATIEPTFRVVRRWLNKLGNKQFYRLLEVRMADIMAHTPDTQGSRIERCNELRQLAAEVIAEGQCFKMKDLAINGIDIMALGVPEGPAVGSLLRMLLRDVMDGVVSNEHEVLVTKAKSYIA